MVAVPHIMPTFSEAAAKTRALGSSIRLAQPLANGANHLLGFTKRGLVCWRPRTDTPTASTTMERSFYTWRNPNCDYLHVLVYTGVTAQTTGKIAVTAGTGTTVESAAGIFNSEQWIEFLAPWDSGDSGFCEVVITGTDVGIGAVAAWELLSRTLDPTTQDCVPLYDTSSPEGGLRAGRYIIESSQAGPKGLIAQTKNAWDYAPRQAVSWWSTGNARSIDSASWTNPFDPVVFVHRARRKQTESTRSYRIDAYTAGAGTVTSYEWRVSCGDNTVTSGSLSHTSLAWTGSPVTGLDVDTTGDDELTFEMRRTGGSGIVSVGRLSIQEYVA